MTYMGSTWTFGDDFRRSLERKITANEVRKHEERTAPEEVMHRRVAGKTVISRRLR